MKYKYKEAIHREKMCAMISLGVRAEHPPILANASPFSSIHSRTPSNDPTPPENPSRSSSDDSRCSSEPAQTSANEARSPTTTPPGPANAPRPPSNASPTPSKTTPTAEVTPLGSADASRRPAMKTRSLDNIPLTVRTTSTSSLIAQEPYRFLPCRGALQGTGL